MRGSNVIILILLILLVSVVSTVNVVSAVNVDQKVIDSLNEDLDFDGTVNVIVVLKDFSTDSQVNSLPKSLSKPLSNSKLEINTVDTDNLMEKKEIIKINQEKVLNELKLKKKIDKNIVSNTILEIENLNPKSIGINVFNVETNNSKTNNSNIEQNDFYLEKNDYDLETNNSNIEQKDYDFELKHQYSTINGFSGMITKAGLEKLKQNSDVKEIILSEDKHIFIDQTVPDSKGNLVWNYSIDGVVINGTGFTACVLDTGVDYTHPALGGCTNESFLARNCEKVPDGYDFFNDDTFPMDDNGHGTHVSGIIASTNNTYRGMAPGAKIIAMKVCNSAGSSCPDADILAAIDWCVLNASIYNISVISISLGGGQETTYCDATYLTFSSAINSAVQNNISVENDPTRHRAYTLSLLTIGGGLIRFFNDPESVI